jgi:hypothetical protein
VSPELRPVKHVATAALWLILGLTTLDAFAQAGGQPLILDTQTGIHSGAGGTVLQTGPLNGTGMVQARPTAALQELPQQDQQTIVVSPYIELQQGAHPGGQGYGLSTGSQPSSSSSRHRSRSTSPPSGGSYGVPSGAQTPASVTTQPAMPQAHVPPGQPPIITPIPVSTPKSVAAKPASTAPTRSSGPHTVSGSVTTSLD